MVSYPIQIFQNQCINYLPERVWTERRLFPYVVVLYYCLLILIRLFCTHKLNVQYINKTWSSFDCYLNIWSIPEHYTFVISHIILAAFYHWQDIFKLSFINGNCWMDIIHFHIGTNACIYQSQIIPFWNVWLSWTVYHGMSLVN